jgi:hypothetical protein
VKPLDLDAMKRAMPTGARGALHALIGCDWGRGIAHPSDMAPCMDQATKKMVIHAPPAYVAEHPEMPAQREYKFCARHFDLAEGETVRHEGSIEEGALDSSDYPNVPTPEAFVRCGSTKFTFRTGAMQCSRRAGHSSLRPHFHAPTEDEWT